MPADDLYKEFIKKLKKDKSEEEVAEFLANLLKLGSAELYFTAISQLKEEDFEAIDKITDDKKAEEEINKRFTLRTGVTPQEFVNKLRDTISKNYLYPELNPKK